MSQSIKPRLLINLPPTFFTQPQLQSYFERFEKLAAVRATSHNTTEALLSDLGEADAVIMWAWPAFSAAQLAQTPVRFVGQINTTQAHVKACFDRGVAISEVRHCWSPAVAEMALALMLDGLRRTGEHHLRMRAGTETWIDAFPADIDPRERQLTGRKVGIVGFGGIGQRLSQLLQPFQCDIRIYDPFLLPQVAAQFGVRQAELMELVTKSDVVVLCAANQPGAARLMGKNEIDALKKDAVLVNVGRSMLVDMPALADRLQRGDLIALLDVFDNEPLEADSLFRLLPNVYLTPHRAGGILESVERALSMLADDYEAFLEGRPLKYAVTERMITSFPA